MECVDVKTTWLKKATIPLMALAWHDVWFYFNPIWRTHLWESFSCHCPMCCFRLFWTAFMDYENKVSPCSCASYAGRSKWGGILMIVERCIILLKKWQKRVWCKEQFQHGLAAFLFMPHFQKENGFRKYLSTIIWVLMHFCGWLWPNRISLFFGQQMLYTYMNSCLSTAFRAVSLEHPRRARVLHCIIDTCLLVRCLQKTNTLENGSSPFFGRLQENNTSCCLLSFIKAKYCTFSSLLYCIWNPMIVSFQLLWCQPFSLLLLSVSCHNSYSFCPAEALQNTL